MTAPGVFTARAGLGSDTGKGHVRSRACEADYGAHGGV
jgi:hypothetical protein